MLFIDLLAACCISQRYLLFILQFREIQIENLFFRNHEAIILLSSHHFLRFISFQIRSLRTLFVAAAAVVAAAIVVVIIDVVIIDVVVVVVVVVVRRPAFDDNEVNMFLSGFYRRKVRLGGHPERKLMDE